MKNTIPFIITKTGKNNLGVDLTKHVQTLYAESYTMLIKEIKEDINTWQDLTMLMGWKSPHGKDANFPQIGKQV